MDHVGDGPLAAVEHTVHIGAEELLPQFIGAVGEQLLGSGDACVVHQQIHPAPEGLHLAEHLIHLLGIPHVSRDG